MALLPLDDLTPLAKIQSFTLTRGKKEFITFEHLHKIKGTHEFKHFSFPSFNKVVQQREKDCDLGVWLDRLWVTKVRSYWKAIEKWRISCYPLNLILLSSSNIIGFKLTSQELWCNPILSPLNWKISFNKTSSKSENFSTHCYRKKILILVKDTVTWVYIIQLGQIKIIFKLNQNDPR